MITRVRISSVFFLPAVWLVASLFAAAPARAQNVQVDLSATSALCGGQECFNTAGIFSNGTAFLGTAGMDNGNNCTPTPPFTNCPDAYSAQQLFGSAFTPTSTTPPSLTIGGVPFTFGPVNTASCGPSTSTNCTLDMVNLTGAGVVITLPVAEQQKTPYSTMIMLGAAVNGHHTGNVIATYTDGSSSVFNQTFSDWCGFGGNPFESIAVAGINRINSDGTLNGASCNLYAYTYPLNFNNKLESITLQDTDGSGASFALAITLKPPTYTIDGGTASPATVAAGGSTTATITVNPQPGYVGTVQLSCAISPAIVTSGSATAPTCSLNPTSVDVTASETAPPTSMLTFTAAQSSQARLGGSANSFYALWLPVTGLAFAGIGAGSRTRARRKLFVLFMLGLLLAGIAATPACVSYKHLGNVGTPPGQYTISVVGVDGNGLTQASNAAGTSNTVVVMVNQ